MTDEGERSKGGGRVSELYHWGTRGPGWQKDAYDEDRELVRAVGEQVPVYGTDWARNNLAFVGRAAAAMAGMGVDGYIDVGCGRPMPNGPDAIVRRTIPDARWVCVDLDPVILVHRAVGRHKDPHLKFVTGDVTDPETLLANEHVTALIDRGRPIGVMLNALLHLVTDAQDPTGIVRTLVAPLPSGSLVSISHATYDHDREPQERLVRLLAEHGRTVVPRSRDELATIVDGAGLELLDPGIVATTKWRPDKDAEISPDRLSGAWALLARKS